MLESFSKGKMLVCNGEQNNIHKEKHTPFELWKIWSFVQGKKSIAGRQQDISDRCEICTQTPWLATGLYILNCIISHSLSIESRKGLINNDRIMIVSVPV